MKTPVFDGVHMRFLISVLVDLGCAKQVRSDMFFRSACTLCFVFQNADLNHEKLHFASVCTGNFCII